MAGKRKSKNLNNTELINEENQNDDQDNDPMNQENENIENEHNGVPSAKKKRKLTSPVWPHFDLKIDDVDQISKFAHCKYCTK